MKHNDAKIADDDDVSALTASQIGREQALYAVIRDQIEQKL